MVCKKSHHPKHDQRDGDAVPAERDEGVASEETALIGDQLFTDVLGGNRLGLLTIWVRARSRREFLATQIVRQVERIVVRRLEKKKRMPEEGWL